MEFFIDTANMEEMKEAYELGINSGITTNPSLVDKEDFHQWGFFRCTARASAGVEIDVAFLVCYTPADG